MVQIERMISPPISITPFPSCTALKVLAESTPSFSACLPSGLSMTVLCFAVTSYPPAETCWAPLICRCDSRPIIIRQHYSSKNNNWPSIQTHQQPHQVMILIFVYAMWYHRTWLLCNRIRIFSGRLHCRCIEETDYLAVGETQPLDRILVIVFCKIHDRDRKFSPNY